MKKSGFFWHVHHRRILLEWCYDYDERAEYIRTEKSFHEQELRLRLFQPVKGQLPQEVVEAGNTFGEARNAYDEARNAYFEAYIEARNTRVEAGKAYDEVERAHVEARNAYLEARNAYLEALSNHRDEIEALHAQECLDCPWDEETIFSAA